MGRLWTKLMCALVVAGLGIATASGAAGEVVPNKPPTVQISETRFTPDGGVQPVQLPKAKPAPVALVLTAKVGNLNGEHPPALRELAIELDRNISIDLARVPACRPLPSDPPRTLAEACPDSIIGTGAMALEIQLAEGAPIATSSSIRIFNGPRRDGARTIYLAGYITAPVPAGIIETARLKKVDDGRYGSEMTVAIPKIAGGSGSITSLDLRIKRRLRLAGKWFSPITASCPDGKLQIHDKATFFNYETGETTTAAGELLRTCVGR